MVVGAIAAQRLYWAGRAVTRKVRAPHATLRGACPQFRCVWPKRWQRLDWTGPFGAKYVSTDTLRPQSSVRARNLDTSGPRTTDTMRWGMGGPFLAGSWFRGRTGASSLPGRECPGIPAPAARRPQASYCRGFQLAAARSGPLGPSRCGKSHHLPTSREPSTLTVAVNPSAVAGTTTKFSAFSWAVNALGHDSRSHARNALLSLNTVIKMGSC